LGMGHDSRTPADSCGPLDLLETRGQYKKKAERHRTMAEITSTETLHVPVLLKRAAVEYVFNKTTWTSLVRPVSC